MKFINSKSVKDLIHQILIKEKVEPQVAHYVAEGLVSASLRGVDSHGIRLIHHYLSALEAGRINPAPRYRTEQTKPATAILDADHTFGHAAGMEAAHLAVKMAAENGCGLVAIKNSTHFGAAAYFALEIARHDMIGMSFTHSDSLIIPFAGKRSYLGNNPICFAAPVKDEPPFCLDMATSIITFNEIKRLRETGQKAPEGVGADKNGLPSTDPNEITMLLPVGSYKGYGLSLMVEILCSMLTGMNFGSHISKMYGNDIGEKRHLGHFISAYSIDAFCDADIFKTRMADLLNELRNEPAADTEQPVMTAGDPEKLCEKKRKTEGIPLSLTDFEKFETLNQKYQLNIILEQK